jgi:hypothetical protein
MDNVLNKLTDQIKKELPGEPEARKNALEETKNTRNEYLTYLKDRGDIVKILKLIRDKKKSNRTIRIKIKEYLKDPEEINNFLESVKNSTKKYKKEETKETTSTSGAAGMSYDTKLFGEPQKTETKEATSTASSGQYSTPKMWAKSTSKKDWRGKSKPQIPGGKFVQVKKKCKRFPYCNQGDIKALNIFENEVLNRVMNTVSEKYGIDVETIKTIIISEWNKRNN